MPADRLGKLHAAAIQIAAFPPLKASHGGNAYVAWDLISSLRAELDALGVDWRRCRLTATRPPHGGKAQ